MGQAANKKYPKIEIVDRQDADGVLQWMGTLEDHIAEIEIREREVIRAALQRMVKQTEGAKGALKVYAAALEKWAREDEAAWRGRALVLNFGRLFFRESTGAISLKRSVKYVLDHLKAKKLLHCIRTVEEPIKEAIKALDDATLKEIGCKREKPDYFHYEVFKTEVK